MKASFKVRSSQVFHSWPNVGISRTCIFTKFEVSTPSRLVAYAGFWKGGGQEQARRQDLEKGGLFWKSEKCANNLDSNFHWSWISCRRFVRKLRQNVSESSKMISKKKKKKKKKVFAKIQSDFSAEIRNSKVFSAQN